MLVWEWKKMEKMPFPSIASVKFDTCITYNGSYITYIMIERLIPQDKSVIVAVDVKPSKISSLIQETQFVEGIGGYKVGISSIGVGLNQVVGTIKDETSLPVIYDHQKAGNDIPATGKDYAEMCKEAGVDSVILFPFTGPETEVAWIRACQDQDLHIIVGAHMTHPGFLQSQGGSIADDSPQKIFTIAVGEGVRDFVVPGNQIQYVAEYKQLLDSLIGEGQYRVYAPGFVTQGGEISDFAKAAGDQWHAIVGSAIYKAENMREAAEQMTKGIK